MKWGISATVLLNQSFTKDIEGYQTLLHLIPNPYSEHGTYIRYLIHTVSTAPFEKIQPKETLSISIQETQKRIRVCFRNPNR